SAMQREECTTGGGGERVQTKFPQQHPEQADIDDVDDIERNHVRRIFETGMPGERGVIKKADGPAMLGRILKRRNIPDEILERQQPRPRQRVEVVILEV